MSEPRVELEIGTLVVDGLGPLDAERVRSAAAGELERLIGAGEGWPARPGGEAAELDAGRIELGAGASADAVGVEIARAVHGGLAR